MAAPVNCSLRELAMCVISGQGSAAATAAAAAAAATRQMGNGERCCDDTHANIKPFIPWPWLCDNAMHGDGASF